MKIWQTGIPEQVQARLIREHVEAMSDQEALIEVRALLRRAAYELFDKGEPADHVEHVAVDALKARLDGMIYKPRSVPTVTQFMYTLRREDGEPIDGDEAQWLVAKPEGWEDTASAYVHDEPVTFVLEKWELASATTKLIGPEK